MNSCSNSSRRRFLRSTAVGLGSVLIGDANSLSAAETASVDRGEHDAKAASLGPTSDVNTWIERIFGSRELEAKTFGPALFDEDQEAYVVSELVDKGSGVRELVSYEAESGTRRVLVSASELVPPGQHLPLVIEAFEFAKAYKKVIIYANSERVWRERTRGDYWLLDCETHLLRKLGGDAPPSSLMFAKFSPDGTKIAYVHANNIYVEDIPLGKITALTTDGSETTLNGTFDWVYEEEFTIHDGFRWSPDGSAIAYWQFDTRPVAQFSMINDLGAGFREPITTIPYPQYGVYPKISSFRIPSAGTPNSGVRIGVVGLDDTQTRWMEIVGDPEKSYIPRLEWAGSADELLIQHLNRTQNTNDLYLVDAHTGKACRILRDTDEAWVDINDDTRWLPKHKAVLWISERDGWRHAYLIARDGSGARLITHGNLDVIEIVAVDPAEKWVFFIASPENATQRYLYRTRIDGSTTVERITPRSLSGTNSYEIAPDCRWAFHTWSVFGTAPTTSLVRLPQHQRVRVLSDNGDLNAKLAPLTRNPVEFFQVDIGDGTILDAWMMKPQDFNPLRKYPILFYVYGEAGLQTVVDAWESEHQLFERQLFHRALANAGYLVASVDNRGTPAPKGRGWRKAIYGAVGVLSSKEQAAAVRAIVDQRSYVDLDRVAVWGWSGGGTNTLNLLFRSPEIYKLGISVAPVPEQRIYDTVYQERYMGLPEANIDGYKSASAINYAENLRGRLLLVHGTADDNTHFAGSELLVNRLIELGKPFDFMAYPNRSHRIFEGAGTSMHVFKLLARYLMTYLPPCDAPGRVPTNPV